VQLFGMLRSLLFESAAQLTNGFAKLPCLRSARFRLFVQLFGVPRLLLFKSPAQPTNSFVKLPHLRPARLRLFLQLLGMPRSLLFESIAQLANHFMKLPHFRVAGSRLLVYQLLMGFGLLARCCSHGLDGLAQLRDLGKSGGNGARRLAGRPLLKLFERVPTGRHGSL
jgi:hypothetical protein